MKYAVIGLGNLGRSLAENLLHIGNEVVGIDRNMQKIDAVKQHLTSVVCMDSTDVEALQSLSLDKFDGVFVTFSKDFGVSVQTVALLKSINVHKIIVRAVSEVHKTVLQSIGVTQIITPEKEFASEFVLKLLTRGLFREKFEIGEDCSVWIINTPQSMIGEELNFTKFKDIFHLDLLCIRRLKRKKNILGLETKVYEIEPIDNNKVLLVEQDQLVLFGTMDELRAFGNL